MSIVVMKRKAAAKGNPVSRKGFSLNGKHLTTRNSQAYIKRDRCCKSVARELYQSQGDYTRDCIYNQDTSAATDRETAKNCPQAPTVASVNGQNGSTYESYADYVKRLRSSCKK